MPRPLGQEIPPTPTHERVRDLITAAYKARMAPVGIIFSCAGYEVAQSQTVPGMRAWGGQPGSRAAETYLGFPFTIVAEQVDDVQLTTVPGGSAEAHAFRASRAVERPATNGPAIRTRIERLGDRPTLEVLAEGLTRAQLCDLISGWCVANPTDSMVPGLSAVLRDHQ